MKKILLATTMLTMTAGYAAADVVWGADANVGIAQNGTKNDGRPQAGNPVGTDPETYTDEIDASFRDDTVLAFSFARVTMTGTGQTDGGITFGATFSFSTGVQYTFADDDGFDRKAGTGDDPTIFIAGDFGKLTFSVDNLDGFDGDESWDGEADILYEGNFGGFTLGVLSDVNSGNSAVKAAFSINGFGLSAEYSQDNGKDRDGNEQLKDAGDPATTDDDVYYDDIWNFGVTYTVNDIVFTLATDNNEETTIKGEWDSDAGYGAAVKYNISTDNLDIDANFTYNGVTVDLSTSTDENDWSVAAGYDLGGVTIGAGVNYTNDAFIGARMKF
jgi:hypothetical protein